MKTLSPRTPDSYARAASVVLAFTCFVDSPPELSRVTLILSRVEVACELINLLRLNGSVKISEVSSDYFQKEYFVPRPASERLINARLNEDGLDVMRDWKTSLSEYLSEDYPNYIN